MLNSAILRRKFAEVGPLLRRSFWQPLHRMMAIFHILPLTAALIVFFIFATNDQLREIYISYLENLAAPGWQRAPGMFAGASAAVALTLLSAVLYAAHHELSSMRSRVVYSAYSNAEAASRLRVVQRTAAVVLALLPWFGVLVGLLGARDYLIKIYGLLQITRLPAADAALMQPLHAPRLWEIFLCLLALAFSCASFSDFYRKDRFVQWSGLFVTPLMMAFLFLLLVNASPGIDMRNWVIGAGLGAIALIAANIWLYQRPPRFVYHLGLPPGTGLNPAQCKRIFFFFWAAFPWIVIALCFVAASALGGPKGEVLAPSWGMIPVAMTWVVTIGLVVARCLDEFRDSSALRYGIVAAVLLLMLICELAAAAGGSAIVAPYRAIGPLSTIAFELVLVIAPFALLAWLSQKSGFPALALVILTLVVSTIFPIPITLMVIVLTTACVILAVMAALSRLFVVALLALIMVSPGALNLARYLSEPTRVPVLSGASGVGNLSLCQEFENWLGRPGRQPGVVDDFCASSASATSGQGAAALSSGGLAKSAAAAPPSYKAFIIAVEGGGIYATAAASLVLAELQDELPNFSQHVFVISGVSGGAIGSTIFRVLDDAAQTAPPASPDRRGRIERQVAQIVQDDHLSPVVGALFPEQLFGAWEERAKALIASFESSVRAQDRFAADELGTNFLGHWSNKDFPALVLNTTWADTGFRVAFSPFRLHDAGDSALYSFSDAYMPGENDISLMEAAVASARFPGILPPYSVTMREGTPERPRYLLWNFVDGGYSDNSGASTALVLYQKLAPIARKRNVDLDLILITNSYAPPQLAPDHVHISGTQFRDTLAPIEAVMNIRTGLTNEALAHVCNVLHDEGCSPLTDHLQIIELDGESFSLPLGWKLSKTTFQIVSWMLGRPELCKQTTAQPNLQAQEKASVQPSRSNFARFMRRVNIWLEKLGLASAAGAPHNDPNNLRITNSCVLKHIEDLAAGTRSSN